MNPESWHDLDPLSGIPLMLNPISVENAFHWQGLLSQELVQTHITIKASTIAVCNIYQEQNKDLLKAQIENAHLILNHSDNGSVFLENRALFPMPKKNHNIVIPCVWLLISMEDLQMLTLKNSESPNPVDIFELEVFKALLPIWIAWHLSLSEIRAQVNNSYFV
jgi:hypothetical protein